MATKSDLDLALQVRFHVPGSVRRLSDNVARVQRHEVQPDVYCRRLFLQVPISVSVITGQTADVFHAVCRVAMNP